MVSTCKSPGMYYDYGGFPPESYKLSYPAPGAADRHNINNNNNNNNNTYRHTNPLNSKTLKTCKSRLSSETDVRHVRQLVNSELLFACLQGCFRPPPPPLGARPLSTST